MDGMSERQPVGARCRGISEGHTVVVRLFLTSFLTSVVVVVLLLDDAFSFRCLAFRLGRREVVQKGGLADASVGVENDAFVF